MPGRRNLARELAQHANEQPARMAAIHAMLTSTFPATDRALIGHAHILHWLHAFGIRRLNTGPLTWRIVNRWRVRNHCPILRGNRHDRDRTPAISTSHALTAWILSGFTTGHLFRVVATPCASPTTRSFPAFEESGAQQHVA